MAAAGIVNEPGEFLACPECNHAEWLADQQDHIENQGAIAHEDGKPLEANPFPALATRYPEDGPTYAAWWEAGWKWAQAEAALPVKTATDFANAVFASMTPEERKEICES